MVRHWFCLITFKNWQITKEKGVYGVWKKWKKRLYQLRPGDRMVFYLIPKLKQIVGIAEVSSEPYDDYNTEIWFGCYPFQVKICILKDVSETSLPLDDVIEKLSLFKGKPLGPVLFGKSIIPMSQEDFEIILKEMTIRSAKARNTEQPKRPRRLKGSNSVSRAN